MGIFGSTVGAALGIGGSIFGGISASKAMKKAKAMVEDEKRDNENWYDRRYNEDATQTVDAQRMMTKLTDEIKNRNQAAAGTQAVMGGTDESVAATKAANSAVLADATSQIAATGQQRRDQVEKQYLASKAELNNKLQGLEVGKAQAVAQAVQGMGAAAAGMGELF